jgi:hypothetical protein
VGVEGSKADLFSKHLLVTVTLPQNCEFTWTMMTLMYTQNKMSILPIDLILKGFYFNKIKSKNYFQRLIASYYISVLTFFPCKMKVEKWLCLNLSYSTLNSSNCEESLKIEERGNHVAFSVCRAPSDSQISKRDEIA